MYEFFYTPLTVACRCDQCRDGVAKFRVEPPQCSRLVLCEVCFERLRRNFGGSEFILKK